LTFFGCYKARYTALLAMLDADLASAAFRALPPQLHATALDIHSAALWEIDY
jgi:hypothetical protein